MTFIIMADYAIIIKYDNNVRVRNFTDFTLAFSILLLFFMNFSTCIKAGFTNI